MAAAVLALAAVFVTPGLHAQDAPPSTTSSEGLANLDSLEAMGNDRIRMAFAPDNRGTAERLLRQASNFGPLPGLPAHLPSSVTIVVAADETAFTRYAGGAVPEWGAAVAIPSWRRMVVPGYASNRARGFEEGRVLAHEWAHLGLHEYLGELAVPRWFSEGYAEWAAGGRDASRGWRLRVAIARRQAPPLDSLSLSWPARRGEAEIAYLLSGTAVEYLVSESGVDGLTQLFETWKSTQSFETAFRSTYGLTSGQFEEDWRAFVRKRYGWLLILSESVVFWAFFGVVLSALWWSRRRRSNEQMARLRATEPPEAPEFWNGADRSNPQGQGGYVNAPWNGEDPRPAHPRTSDRPDVGARAAAENPQE